MRDKLNEAELLITFLQNAQETPARPADFLRRLELAISEINARLRRVEQIIEEAAEMAEDDSQTWN